MRQNLTEPSFEAHKKMIEAKKVGFVKVHSLEANAPCRPLTPLGHMLVLSVLAEPDIIGEALA